MPTPALRGWRESRFSNPGPAWKDELAAASNRSALAAWKKPLEHGLSFPKPARRGCRCVPPPRTKEAVHAAWVQKRDQQRLSEADGVSGASAAIASRAAECDRCELASAGFTQGGQGRPGRPEGRG